MPVVLQKYSKLQGDCIQNSYPLSFGKGPSLEGIVNRKANQKTLYKLSTTIYCYLSTIDIGQHPLPVPKSIIYSLCSHTFAECLNCFRTLPSLWPYSHMVCPQFPLCPPNEIIFLHPAILLYSPSRLPPAKLISTYLLKAPIVLYVTLVHNLLRLNTEEGRLALA